MKRSMVLNLGFVVTVLLLGALAFADESVGMMDKDTKGAHCMMGSRGMMDGKGMADGGRMDSGMMGMMHGMMSKSLVATSDGGVAVLTGNQLTKYDKDLNVVKTAEVKVDMEAMQQSMMGMMKMCRMMKGDMMKDGMMGSEDGSAAASPSSDATDHTAHH